MDEIARVKGDSLGSGWTLDFEWCRGSVILGGSWGLIGEENSRPVTNLSWVNLMF